MPKYLIPSPKDCFGNAAVRHHGFVHQRSAYKVLGSGLRYHIERSEVSFQSPLLSRWRKADNQDFQAVPRLATHSSNTSLKRVCQRAPVPLKHATTAAAHRTVTGVLIGRCFRTTPVLRGSANNTPGRAFAAKSIPQNNSLCDPVRTNTSSPVSSEPCR